MKKFLFTMLVLVGLAVGANAQTKGTLGYLTEKRGFKIFTLNTPIKQYAKHIKFDGDGKTKGEKHYNVSDATLLKVGDIKLRWMQIVTFNDTIQKIGICVEEKYNQAFLDVIKATYGEGRKPNRYIEQYYWYAPKVTLSYNAEFKGKNGLVLFIDDEVTNKKELFERQQAKENSNDI